MGIMKAVGQGLWCIREPVALGEDEWSVDRLAAHSSSGTAPGKCGWLVAVELYVLCKQTHGEVKLLREKLVCVCVSRSPVRTFPRSRAF